MTEPVAVAPIEAVDTEKAILSGMMQNDRAMAHALSHLRIEEFYDNRHQTVFRALARWHREKGGGGIDLLTLMDLLEGSGAIEEAGGRSCISEGTFPSTYQYRKLRSAKGADRPRSCSQGLALVSSK